MQASKKGLGGGNERNAKLLWDGRIKKVLAIASETTKIVGGCKDGQFYWDAVMTFEDENEATKAGIDNEQIAIYNIEQNRVKRLL